MGNPGYFGPPHIAVRSSRCRKPQEAASARRIGVTWQIISLSGAVFAGLIGIAYIEQRGIDLGDPEAPIISVSLYWQKLTNWGALASHGRGRRHRLHLERGRGL